MHSRGRKVERITRINASVARDINRSIILNTIRRREPISRTQIAELTRLNKSTVSSIVGSLLGENLLTEATMAESGVGRNRVNLSIKRGSHYIGAIAFDSPTTTIALVDIDGTVKLREDIQIVDHAPKVVVQQVCARLRALWKKIKHASFHGIGASVAGVVDATNRRVIIASNLQWEDADIGDLFHANLPESGVIEMENDAKSSALAELMLGSHPIESKDLVFVMIQQGIGTGIIVHGRVLDGHSHAAGEIGHMKVLGGDDVCSCGKTGCWELNASERMPVKWYSQATHQHLTAGTAVTIHDVIGAARRGDKAAIEALKRWATFVGLGIGNIKAMIDPEVIIVGGSITNAWDIVLPEIQKGASDSGIYARHRSTTILPTSLKEEPSLLGAAALAIRRVFLEYTMAH